MALSRATSWVVLAGIAAIAAVAVADALRPEPASVRARDGLAGTLFFTDEHCRLWTVSLPDLDPAPAGPPLQGCRLPFSRANGRPVLLRLEHAGIEEVRRREPLWQTARRVDPRFGQLWVSPKGSFAAAKSDDLQLFDRTGRPLRSPATGSFRGIAWSPDERWAAVATSEGVLFFRTNDPDRTVRARGLLAWDLDWR